MIRLTTVIPYQKKKNDCLISNLYSQTLTTTMKHRTHFTFAGLVLASMLIAGELFAQAVPSLVSQQARLSTGGANPNYVQHRAITSVGAAPGANGWYAWDQVPTPA